MTSCSVYFVSATKAAAIWGEIWRADGSVPRGDGGVDLVSAADAPATVGRMGTAASHSNVALPTRQGETSCRVALNS
jgi:hypothetical protein